MVPGRSFFRLEGIEEDAEESRAHANKLSCYVTVFTIKGAKNGTISVARKSRFVIM